MVKSDIKKKKKEWYSVVAPKSFNNLMIGEATASTPESLIGRVLKVNLSNLSRERRRNNTVVFFKIIQVKEKSALTEFVSYKILPSHIRRIVRASKDKIDYSFICSTKDNVKINFKVLILTKSKACNSILTKLRKNTYLILSDLAKNQSFESLLFLLNSFKLQGQLKFKLKKIYPLSVCEIREFTKK